MAEKPIPQVVLFGSIFPDWREDHIIPVLEELGVTYFNPRLPGGWWYPEHGDQEAYFMAHCETIVQVFTTALPSFTALTETGWAALGAHLRGQTFIMQIDEDIQYGLPDSMKSAPEYEQLNRTLQHWATSSRYLVKKHAAEFNIPNMHVVPTLTDVARVLREKYGAMTK